MNKNKYRHWIYKSELQKYANYSKITLEQFFKRPRCKYVLWEDCPFANSDDPVYIYNINELIDENKTKLTDCDSK